MAWPSKMHGRWWAPRSAGRGARWLRWWRSPNPCATPPTSRQQGRECKESAGHSLSGSSTPPHFVLAPSGPHQNEEVAEEDDAGPHSHEHLAQVHEDGRQEEGVGRQVLKLEAEVFQQQQQERRNWQSHTGGDVRGE